LQATSKLRRNLSICAYVLCLAGIGTYLYASRAARRYRVERERILLGNGNGAYLKERLASKISGRFTILHLSDLHLTAGDEDKAAFLKEVTSDDYDMVVLTGDIFENESGLAYTSSLLLKQPRLGAYAVLGNHDYYSYTLFTKQSVNLLSATNSQKSGVM